MPTVICPRCQQRVLFEKGSSDIEHICNSGNAVLDEEDIVVIGDWEDFTGTGTETNPFSQGAENTLMGTRAGIEGQRKQNKTVRGVRASTRRQRQHIQHINLTGGEQ